MHPFHERLAQVGLSAGGAYGFALAGGYAVQAAGLLDRPSEDVDLFAPWDHSGEFETALAAVIDAYEVDGLDVTVDQERRFVGSFARLYVTDRASGEASKVELGIDWRANDVIHMAIGPVLHPDDAVMNKMGALFGRAEARDFIDVDAAVHSGRYTWEDLLSLASTADSGFDRRMFADVLMRAESLPASRFGEYGMYGRDLDDLRARFADWRAELLR